MTMSRFRTLMMLALAVAPTLGGLAGPARADADDDNSSTPAQAKPACPQGQVMKNGTCQQATRGILPDDTLYAQGRALALAGYYREALPILRAVTRTDDAMVYTMEGYALRKLGRFDRAMALYDRALAIDPNNANTHEYIGEGYVTAGRLEYARAELATLRRICGTDCGQYQDLERAIRTGTPE